MGAARHADYWVPVAEGPNTRLIGCITNTGKLGIRECRQDPLSLSEFDPESVVLIGEQSGARRTSMTLVAQTGDKLREAKVAAEASGRLMISNEREALDVKGYSLAGFIERAPRRVLLRRDGRLFSTDLTWGGSPEPLGEDPSGAVVVVSGTVLNTVELRQRGVTLEDLTSVDACVQGDRTFILVTGQDALGRRAYQFIDGSEKMIATVPLDGTVKARLVRGVSGPDARIVVEFSDGRLEVREPSEDFARFCEIQVTVTSTTTMSDIWTSVGTRSGRVRLLLKEAREQILPEFELPGPIHVSTSVFPGAMGATRSVVRTVTAGDNGARRGVNKTPWPDAPRNENMNLLVVNLLTDRDWRHAEVPDRRIVNEVFGDTSVVWRAPDLTVTTGRELELKIREWTMHNVRDENWAPQLLEQIKGFKPTALYLIGHGFPHDDRGDPLVGRDATSRSGIDPDVLASCLRSAATQFVLVRACHSAKDTKHGWSFAARLHRAGVPVVVGYADALPAYRSTSHHDAIHRGVLTALRDGHSVEKAITDARQGVASSGFAKEKLLPELKEILRQAWESESKSGTTLDEAVEKSVEELDLSFLIRPITYLSASSQGVIGHLSDLKSR